MTLATPKHPVELVVGAVVAQLVELGAGAGAADGAQSLDDARHPYTRGLVDCLPRLGEPRHPLPTLERRAEWAK